jgi:hypothetical protein
MAAMSINRTYGKIAGFWVITQKPLIKTEILMEKRAITPKWVIRFT